MTSAIIKYLGSLVGLVASLPLPWKVRVWVAMLIEKALSLILAYYPQVYQFIIGENKRYGMGKQREGEMESIMGMETILREFESLGIAPARVREIFDEAERTRIDLIDLPRFLGNKLLGQKDTDRLLHRIVAF